VHVEVDVRPSGSGAAALGRHDDDAVGAARTVDRRGGRILEDVDGLDLVGREAAHGAQVLAAYADLGEVIAQHWHAVDDPERIVPGRERGGAAHADGDPVPRVAGVLRDLDARRTPLERRLDAGDGYVRDLAGLDPGHRGGQLTALLRAVADDDELLEGDRRGLERQGHHRRLAGLDGDGLLRRDVADRKSVCRE